MDTGSQIFAASYYNYCNLFLRITFVYRTAAVFKSYVRDEVKPIGIVKHKVRYGGIKNN